MRRGGRRRSALGFGGGGAGRSFRRIASFRGARAAKGCSRAHTCSGATAVVGPKRFGLADPAAAPAPSLHLSRRRRPPPRDRRARRRRGRGGAVQRNVLTMAREHGGGGQNMY
ncbi:Hypothetical protein CINCED_3A017264 [Cinara cedri]|uniref:Uncharacterized protein n=1 Tax=Cinara cedri TaxID=506608 RepID=A0A5E4NFR9_9HEMI|nr:Hypothetical protein CINCED_3A017264 [Cinara cedri]